MDGLQIAHEVAGISGGLRVFVKVLQSFIGLLAMPLLLHGTMPSSGGELGTRSAEEYIGDSGLRSYNPSAFGS